jgi:hypothetical protein
MGRFHARAFSNFSPSRAVQSDASHRIGQAALLPERSRCTVVWNWGDYALFEDDTEWIPYSAPMDWTRNRLVPCYHHIRHFPTREGGARKSWRVAVTKYARVAVTSWFVCCAAEERPLRRYTHFEEHDVVPWLPRPSRAILEKVEAFKRSCFEPHTVGMHIHHRQKVAA